VFLIHDRVFLIHDRVSPNTDLDVVVAADGDAAQRPHAPHHLAQVSQLLVTTPMKLLHINVQRFRGGLVFKAHGILYHSTLGLRVIKRVSRCAL